MSSSLLSFVLLSMVIIHSAVTAQDLESLNKGEDIAGCYGSAYIYNQRVKKGPNKIKVQIPNRPVAFGRFNPVTNKGKVDFTDDQEYKITFNPSTGTIDWDGLERPWSGDKRREWDGTNHWQKDMPDIVGTYNDRGGCEIDIYRTTGNKINVDWSGCNNRPTAKGYVNCPTGAGQPFMGQVDFPDDRVYTLAYFQDQGKIYWDGKSGPDDTNNIWVLDQSMYDQSKEYVAGHYYDFFDLWEVQEMDDEYDVDDEGMFAYVGGMLTSFGDNEYVSYYVMLAVVIAAGLLYFYREKMCGDGKGKYQPLLEQESAYGSTV